MVTGADDGIGRATALGLARMAATVVIGVATLTEGRAAQESITSESGNHAIELMIADLSSQTAIRELVASTNHAHTS